MLVGPPPHRLCAIHPSSLLPALAAVLLAGLAYTGAARATPAQSLAWTSAQGEILVQWTSAAAKPTAAATRALEELDRTHGVYSRTSVFPETAPLVGTPKTAWAPADRSALAEVRRHLGKWHRLRYSSFADAAVVARAYAALPLVAQAQPNYIRRFCDEPDDPMYSTQWNLPAMGWDHTAVPRADDVLVAIIDSGLDLDHPDIVSQVFVNIAELRGVDGVDDDGNGYVDDVNGWDFTDAPSLPGRGDYLERDADPTDESGHGTHVAGIIAAGVGNGIGIAGIAPGVRVMPLRAGFNVADGSGYLEDDDIAAAIIYAADNGAHILNMSFGDPRFSPLMRDAVRYAFEAGCVCVAAVGNEGNSEVFYPARHDETIAVAASGQGGGMAHFSNWGYSVDLTAPGQAIRSLDIDGYGDRSGTSMAAAHVSGLAALALARTPQLTASQIGSVLAGRARDVTPSGWDPRSGAGIVRVAGPLGEVPTAVRIIEPPSGAELDGALEETEIRIGISGFASAGYDISWGVGETPSSWTELLSAVHSADRAYAEVTVPWNTAGLPDGSYAVRVRVSASGLAYSDRVAVRLWRQEPEITGLKWYRALAGPIWDYFVEWMTDVPAGERAQVTGAGGDVLYDFEAPAERTTHVLNLPSEWPAGSYEVTVSSGAAAADGKATAIVVDIEERGVHRWALDRIARAPDGYLMPVTTDFDGDGRREFAAMVFADGSYNTTSFFEVGPGLDGAEAESVHQTSQSFIPWNSHDADDDGLQEVMAVDAQRVRLLEAESAGAFPTRVVWQVRESWGGEVDDLDGDGMPDLYLRSSRAELFRVFEATGMDNSFEEVATLANPTSGSNGLGERQLTADLDGDGRRELLVGDDDGDLFAYESIGDNAYRSVWSLEGQGDARVLGGAADLDADGHVEFVSARFEQDAFALSEASWTISIFGVGADGDYRPEATTRILGGKASGNGIAAGDLNGDGMVELVVALVPDVYILRYRQGQLEPVWHATTTLDPHRPVIADFDGAGGNELVFNTGGQVEVHALPGQLPLPAPSGLAAVPTDSAVIALRWEAAEGAEGYRLFRMGEGGDGLVVLRDLITETVYEDGQINAGSSYQYAVSAVTSDGVEGFRSPLVSVVVSSAPRVLGLERVSRYQLALLFDVPMGGSATESHRYRLEPDIGHPSSVIADQQARRFVLSFERALPDSGNFTMVVRAVASATGFPLPQDSSRLPIALEAIPARVRLLEAQVTSPFRVVLRFSAPVSSEGPVGDLIEIDAGRVSVTRAHVEGKGNEVVVVEVDENTPLRAFGRPHEIVIAGLRDALGQTINGRALVSVSATSIDDVVVFPNPFNPHREAVTFGQLPLDASVRIISLAGDLVRSLEETDGDGGLQWDGRNAVGRTVESGLYYYLVTHDGSTRRGKVAVIR